MRRSEMVKLMYDFISKEVECYYDTSMTKDDTSELLTRMEKAGMLPPKYKKYLNDNEREDFGSDTPGYYFGWAMINEWESEDPEIFPDGAK